MMMRQVTVVKRPGAELYELYITLVDPALGHFIHVRRLYNMSGFLLLSYNMSGQLPSTSHAGPWRIKIHKKSRNCRRTTCSAFRTNTGLS